LALDVYTLSRCEGGEKIKEEKRAYHHPYHHLSSMRDERRRGVEKIKEWKCSFLVWQDD
jgi:hypothetical protein